MKSKVKIRKQIRNTPTVRRSYKISTFLIATGLILISVWGIHKVVYSRSIRLTDTLLQTFTLRGDLRSAPTFITIPGKISLAVVEAGMVNGVWIVAPRSANHVQQSASPGQPGNIIIYAHNLPDMFGPLQTVKVGEDITIRTKDNTVHRYVTLAVAEVTVQNTFFLQPTRSETLTLYTCSGFLDSKRFIVRAVPKGISL